MTITIQHKKGSFSERWIAYCKANQIGYKLVDSYKPDIMQQLNDSYALTWHFNQNSYKDFLLAKRLICSVEVVGNNKFFPRFHSS